MAKSPQDKLAKKERKAARAQRAVIKARKATLPGVQQSGPPAIPSPGAYEDFLFGDAIGGDAEALRQLRKSGFASYYISELRHTMETTHDPAYKVWCAKCLDVLDPVFDAYAPLPRSPQ